jgi:aminomethyltransferase
MKSRDHFHHNVYPSPFHSRLEPLNKLKEWGRWHDYQSADTYFCDSMEYFAVRNTCGVFDLTPMEKHRITGPDALPYLERLLTRNAEKVKPGRVGYCVWCDDNGRLLDDGTLFHLREGDYRLCTLEPQLDWLLTNAIGFDVNIRVETHDVAALALQGPTSCAVLKRMQLTDIENLKPFGITHYTFAGHEMMVSRTGYSGDLGYELWIDPSAAEELWDRLFEAGSEHGITPMGGNALDLVRIEAGLLLCGVDFLPADATVRPERTRSPYDVGLGWLVDLSKPCFNGRRALIEEHKRGSRYNFVKLDIDGNKPAHDSFIMSKNEKTVGHVTSAMWSPSAKANIAFASLEAPHGKPGEEFLAEIYYQRELKWTRVLAPCRVIDHAFYEPPGRRMTPAPDF